MSHFYNPVILFFHRCLRSRHNEPFFSLHPFFLSVVLIWRNRGSVWTLFSPPHVPDWDSSQPRSGAATAWRRSLRTRGVSWRGEHPFGTVPTPNWHLTGAWETGVFPSPRSSAQGLHPRERFHHSLSAIHKQPPTPITHPSPSLAHPLPSTLLHIHISISIFHAPSFIILTFHTDFWASLLWLWAMWAPVPSLQYAEVTACPTCHCRRNKGVRYDTCPCYTPLCIFKVSAIPWGQKSVSDKSHTMGNKFWTLSGSLRRHLTGLSLCVFKTSSHQSQLCLYYVIIQHNEASGAIPLRLKVIWTKRDCEWSRLIARLKLQLERAHRMCPSPTSPRDSP